MDLIRRLLLLVALITTVATAQRVRLEDPFNVVGRLNLQNNANLPSIAVSALPGSPQAGDVVYVNDAATSASCSVGGGSTKLLCRYNGSSWDVVAITTVDDAAVPDLETLSWGLTAGSVVFSDGSNPAQDNSELFWDNTGKRLGIGINTGWFAQRFEIADTPASWNISWPTVETALSTNVGGYDESTQHRAGLVEALSGKVAIPNTATWSGHAAGVSGYAITSDSGSPGTGAVGVYGQGTVNADTTQAWGANFVVTNCAEQSQGACGTARDGTTLYGVEINTTYTKPSVETAALVRGLYLVGGSAAQPISGFRAIDVDQAGIFSGIAWKDAFYTADGAAEDAIDIGTTGTGNNVGSQDVRFRSRDSGGTNEQWRITTDAGGNAAFQMVTNNNLFSFSGTSVSPLRILPIAGADVVRVLDGSLTVDAAVDAGFNAIKLTNQSEANNTTKYVNIQFEGETQAGAATTVAHIRAAPTDADWVGSELQFQTRVGSTTAIAFQMGAIGDLGFTKSTAHGSLPASPNGTILYCSDCTDASAPCTSGGNGAFAMRENGAWNCD